MLQALTRDLLYQNKESLRLKAQALLSSSQRSNSQSGLSFSFSKSKPAVKRDSTTDLGAFYNNSYQDRDAPIVSGSPNSLSSAESTVSYGSSAPTRHNSMANLKRFSKSTPTTSQPMGTLNLSSSLRSASSGASGAMNIPNSLNGQTNNGYQSPSSFSASTSNTSYSQSPGTNSSSVTRSSTLQNKVNYHERRQSVLGIVNNSQQLPFLNDTTVRMLKV